MWVWGNFAFSLELFPGDLQRPVPQNGRVHLLVLDLRLMNLALQSVRPPTEVPNARH